MSTAQLRSGIAHLATLANRDLAGLWDEVSDAVRAREALRDVLPALVDRYGAASATLAAEWYDDLRAKRAIRGAFTAIPADLGTAGADVLAGVAVGPLFSVEPDWSAAQTLAEGGLQRRIANYARVTITAASIQDPGAQGWVRVGTGECTWCQQYLDGEVHYVAGYDFPAHDHCGCGAEPAF